VLQTPLSTKGRKERSSRAPGCMDPVPQGAPSARRWLNSIPASRLSYESEVRVMADSTAEATGGKISPPFPWIQTRLALERTLLAWVRTGASMIGFGFAIFHFFEALNASPGVRPPWRHGSSKVLGLSLVGVGTLALALALIQYLTLVRYLDDEPFLR